MVNLVNNTFSIMLRLNAPARDNTLNETKDMIIKKIQNTTSVGEILAIYLKHVHMCIEFYHNDFRNAVNTDKIDELKHLINGDKFNFRFFIRSIPFIKLFQCSYQISYQNHPKTEKA